MNIFKWFRKLSKNTKKILLGSTATAILAFFGYLGILKNDIIPVVRDSLKPQEKYIKCEQDGNIRGVLLDKTNIKDSDYIEVCFGVNKKPNLSMKYFVSQLKDHNYYCMFLESMDMNCDFKFRITENNEILFSFEIYDENNCLVGKVDESMFVLNKNCQFTWNRDDYGFEVIDNNFNVVVSFHYTPPNIISFQGLINNNGANELIYDEGTYFIGNRGEKDISIEDEHKLKMLRKYIKPMFEYVGTDWFGKRASTD